MSLTPVSFLRSSFVKGGSAAGWPAVAGSGGGALKTGVQRSSARPTLTAPAAGLPLTPRTGPSIARAGASANTARRSKPWEMTAEAGQQLQHEVDNLLARAHERGLPVHLSSAELLDLKREGLSDELILLGVRLGAPAETIRAFPAYREAGIPINEHTLPSKSYSDAHVVSSRSLVTMPQ